MKRLLWPAIGVALALSAEQPASAGSVEFVDSNGGLFSVQVTSLKEQRSLRTVRQRFDYSCGSAAVATLLTYHFNRPTTEEEVFRAMFARGDQAKIRRKGFSLLDMKRYLDTIGYPANGYTVKFDKIVSVGQPIIVLVREKGYNHFVVVKGLRDNSVLLGDPATGTRVVTRQHFLASWTNGLVFAIGGKRQKEARFNEVADWRVRPRALWGDALNVDSLSAVTLLRPGFDDYKF